MKKLVLSAFACDPTQGSEPGVGWNYSIGIANEGFEVYCFTRIIGKNNIEKEIIPNNLNFYYIILPFGLERLYASSQIGMYLYYILWQWVAYKKAKTIHKKIGIDIAHHVSWGSIQLGSFMYRLGVPFVFGPAGGGQKAPIAFKSFFNNHWAAEEKREKTSSLMLRFNPACKQMLKKAFVVISSNLDTENMLRDIGAKNVVAMLDISLPDSFFPKNPKFNKNIPGRLKLLWVGRFMPRKGIMLLLEVMREIKDYVGITLTVVGDGEMKEDFLNKIKEYKLENTIDWKGKVPYEIVKEYYASNDVFIFTSLRDSGPGQLVEAMAYAMPVISIKLHGQAIIVNDENGISCECPTPEIAISGLKAAILEMYHNPELVTKKSKVAYDFALQQTWKNKIHKIATEYYPQL